MKQKLSIAFSLVVVLAMLLATGALAAVWVTPDTIYPAFPVTVNGDQFDAGESIHVVVTDPAGAIVYDDATVVAAADGTFTLTFTQPETSVEGIYTVTATGVNGHEYTTTYFDPSNTENVDFSTIGLPLGTSVSVSYSGTNPGGNNQNGSATFSAPGPSTTNGFQGSSTLTCTFPTSFTVTGGTYNLSAQPCGASGIPLPAASSPTHTTTVTGTYTFTPAPPANVAPTVEAGGPYSGAEGSSISINGTSAHDNDGDTLLYSWTKSMSGFDAGAACTLTNDTTLSPSLSCTDDGTVTLTLSVDDQHGHVVTDTATVNVTNANPSITSVTNSGPIYEGSSATITVVATDPGSNDMLSYAYDCNNDGTYEKTTGSCSFVDNVGSPFTVGVKVSDDDSGFATSSTQVTVNNANPDVATPTWKNAKVACRVAATLTNISFSDAGVIDYPWTVDINWNDGTSSFTTNDQGALADQTHTYNTPGTYTATVKVTDKDGGDDSATSGSLEVYQTYTVKFLPPFDGSSPSQLITNTMKSGRVVPVKVTIYDDCAQAYVTDPAAVVGIYLSKTSNPGGSNDAIETYADAGSSNGNTLNFRWTSDSSVPGGGFWIYNLDTRLALGGSALVVNTEYRLDVLVGNVKATVSTWGLLKPTK